MKMTSSRHLEKKKNIFNFSAKKINPSYIIPNATTHHIDIINYRYSDELKSKGKDRNRHL